MIVRKLVVTDGRTEREVLLVGTIVVGRDPSCQLNDLDPLLSRRHAEFVPTSKGVTVRDLKSRNGILVNGDKVPERALKPGDVIQLGHLHVRYVEEPVVKSPEDHTRVRAKTETGIEVPTMAASRPAPPPTPAAAAQASAPTEAAPGDSLSDETDMDMTVAPALRGAAALGDLPSFPSLTALRREAVAGEEDDLDATVAPPSHATARAPASRKDEDADATRAWTKATAVAEDPDATIAPMRRSLDETLAPVRSPAPVHGRAPIATEARIVANMSLVITEATPSCQTVIGARPDTIVGGHLNDAITRALRFVATGDGPSALTISVARASSGNTVAVTFKTGQATESHS